MRCGSRIGAQVLVSLVLFVVKYLPSRVTLLSTTEVTLERNHLPVMFVHTEQITKEISLYILMGSILLNYYNNLSLKQQMADSHHIT